MLYFEGTGMLINMLKSQPNTGQGYVAPKMVVAVHNSKQENQHSNCILWNPGQPVSVRKRKRLNGRTSSKKMAKPLKRKKKTKDKIYWPCLLQPLSQTIPRSVIQESGWRRRGCQGSRTPRESLHLKGRAAGPQFWTEAGELPRTGEFILPG